MDWQYFEWMCQVFCVNGRFFLAPQAFWAVGKWES